MLEELKKYDNLGTPGFFWELFHQLYKDDLWTEKDVSAYFFNKSIDGRNVFDGCMPLLKSSKVITVKEDTGEIIIAYPYRNILHSEKLCSQRLLEGFLLAFKEDDRFYEIFSPENSSYDIIYKIVQMDYSAFGLRYANIRRLLIDFSFLIPHYDFPQKKLIINPGWKKFFDQVFAQEIRKRKIGIDELQRNLEQQQANGEMGEKFVIEFELKRLGNKSGIEWVSPYDSAAGYDILSFQNTESLENDRFIEVKTYCGEIPYFYWSKNEISVAKRHSGSYFLYLVNKDKTESMGYEPIIIPNPIENILNNNAWTKEVDKYYIKMEDI